MTAVRAANPLLATPLSTARLSAPSRPLPCLPRYASLAAPWCAPGVSRYAPSMLAALPVVCLYLPPGSAPSKGLKRRSKGWRGEEPSRRLASCPPGRSPNSQQTSRERRANCYDFGQPPGQDAGPRDAAAHRWRTVSSTLRMPWLLLWVENPGC